MPHHANDRQPTPAPAAPRARRAWSPPHLTELPRLVKLTLQTGGAGGAIPGSGSEGGGLVF